MTTTSSSGSKLAADAVPLNDLSRQPSAGQKEVEAAISRVVRSGIYLMGPERDAFEAEFADYAGAGRCVGVGNGTDALELALRGVGCEPGDEVLAAANAGGYATTAALRAGLRMRYADVDPDDLCLSAATVEAAIGPETRAVVVTHLYGRLAMVEGIAELCRERKIALIEDCAQSVGAIRDGRRAGSYGDAAAFSFYPTKNLGALGDAGAVVTDSDEIADRVASLSQYGWEARYRMSIPGGRNSRLDELQAAVLRARLPHLDAWNARRREIATAYARSLPASAGRFPAGDGEDHVAHLTVFLARDRAAAKAALERTGISTAIHYPIADHRQPFWSGAFEQVSLPVTEDAVERVLTVPCFPTLTDDELDRVCEGLAALG